MPNTINDRLLSWASILDDVTLRQAAATSRLDVLAGHIALMPDAHYGIGSTVGSVIPTESVILPSAIGVDIGCGMIATETDLDAAQLPDDLRGLLDAIARSVPAGVGVGHADIGRRADRWLGEHQPGTELSHDLAKRALTQFGTLGGGNHFVEVCLDERDRVWLVLHSGSRGVGNVLARSHIAVAERLAREAHLRLEDPALAYFIEGTAEFAAYITDMLWAQDYAMASRQLMMERAARAVLTAVGAGRAVSTINCHHNYSSRETHQGRQLWITRKGAIKADHGDLGVIPGSMGTRSYVVRGLGNELSWNSCSHGAGRVVGRKEAERRFTVEQLREQMAGKVWLEDRAEALLDEIPSAYKDIDQVMEDQRDLVEVVHTLHQIVNYKGE